MGRTWAIIERELRRFRRSPVLIIMALIMPIVQLVILGYAFGGNVKHLKLAIVDQDHGMPAVRIRELASPDRRPRLVHEAPGVVQAGQGDEDGRIRIETIVGEHHGQLAQGLPLRERAP